MRVLPRDRSTRYTVRRVEALSIKHVAIDGKTLRGSGTAKLGPLHLVSAVATGQRLSVGQVAVDAKSNEITANPWKIGRSMESRLASKASPRFCLQLANAVQMLTSGNSCGCYVSRYRFGISAPATKLNLAILHIW